MSSLAVSRRAPSAPLAPHALRLAPPLWLLTPVMRDYVAALIGFVACAARGEADLAAPGRGIDAATAARIVEAFAKPERTPRFRRWSELLAWCRFAATPAARHVLALHGEEASFVAAAEALGTAIMLLRVVRFCRADYAAGRVFLPADWMREAGCAEESLAARRASPELRTVLDRVLGRAERMIGEARPGLLLVREPGLRRWSAVAVALAAAWARVLRRRDPLRRDATLSRARRLFCLGAGMLRAARAS
jgi:hydroxysqualene synthase